VSEKKQEKTQESKKAKERFKNYYDIPVTLFFDLAEVKVKLRDFLKWKVNDVIKSNKMAGEYIDISIEDQSFGAGEVIVLDNKFAIRIINIYTREDLMELNVKK